MVLPDIRSVFWMITHPLEAIAVKIVQEEVAMDWRLPPPGTTIEGFPHLPLQEAAEALRGQRKSVVIFDGGVPQNALSGSDKERMAQGEKP